MNYLLAKVKRKLNHFRVLSTDDDIYVLPENLNDAVNYNPATLLDEEQWYKFESFSESEFSIELLKDDFDSVNYNQITNVDTSKISYLCSVQGDNYFFQIINSSLLIRKKWFSLDELSIETNKPIITINSLADAIYKRESDILYFTKLPIANRIFKGMDQLYREATDQETQDFLSSDFLSVEQNFCKEKVTVPNRKRIALVAETLSRFSPAEKQGIYDYIDQYGQVSFTDGKFKIDTDEDLKYVLWGIEQRFYTTPISGEKRVANSVISLQMKDEM